MHETCEKIDPSYNSVDVIPNDCDDSNNLVYTLNSCGLCGTQPVEVACNGVDDDCNIDTD